VTGVTDRGPEAWFGGAVPGDDRSAGGAYVDEVRAEPVGHHNGRCGEFGWDGVLVSPPTDQRLPGRGPFLGHDHRERDRWQRA